MKHITFADKNFLVGTDIADAILEYAGILGETHTADTVDINAIGADGDSVRATLFLSAGVPLVAETTTSPLPEPDNAETLAYIEGRLALHVTPKNVQPEPVVDEQEQELEDWLNNQESTPSDHLT
jgi:hypothetical protein